MPRNEQVEHRHRESQTSLKMFPSSVKDLLEMADGRQKRQGSLDNHAFIVGMGLTDFQIGMISLLSMKTNVRENDRLFRKVIHHRLEVGVMDIDGSEIPSDDQSQMIEQPAQLSA